MPNKNYIKGANKERLVVNKAREQGYISFRSAGSHSPIDVVIIKPIEKEIHLIQCKPNSMSEKARNRLREQHKHLNTRFNVHFEVL